MFCIKELLDEFILLGFNINEKDTFGRTPLHYCMMAPLEKKYIRSDWYQCAKKIISSGGQPYQHDKFLKMAIEPCGENQPYVIPVRKLKRFYRRKIMPGLLFLFACRLYPNKREKKNKNKRIVNTKINFLQI